MLYLKKEIAPEKLFKLFRSFFKNRRGGVGINIKDGFELGSHRAESELGVPQASNELGACDPGLENSPRGTEFFPDERKHGKRPKGAGSKKLIAAIFAASLGVGALVLSQEPPPVSKEVTVLEYREGYYDEVSGAHTDPSYDLFFSFDLMGYTAESISLKGTVTEDMGMGPEVIAEIDETVLAEDLVYSDDGSTVGLIYTVDNAYNDYNITPTLHYSDGGRSSRVKGEGFCAAVPRLKFSEMEDGGTVIATVNEDTIDFNVSFDIQCPGCFEFRVESVLIINQHDEINFGEDGTPPLPEVKDGRISFDISLERPPQGRKSLEFQVHITGDAYYNGVKMNLDTSSHAGLEVILGEAYNIAAPSISPIEVNGLTLKDMRFNAGFGGYLDSMDRMIPGRTVYILFVFEGVALKDGILSLDVTANTAKLGELDLTYATGVEISDGDEYVTLELSFIMPGEDVEADDIVINGVIFDEMLPVSN